MINYEKIGDKKMNVKKELQRLLGSYEREAEGVHNDMQQIRKNDSLSDTGKAQAEEAVNKKYQSLNALYKKLSDEVLDTGLKTHRETIQGRLTSPDYQLKLNNMLRIFELTGDELEAHELNLMVEPFLEDEIAKKAIYKAIQKHNPDFQNDILNQAGKVAKSIENMEKVRGHFHDLLREHRQWGGWDGVSLRIFNLQDALDKFTDKMIWDPKGV